MMDLTTELDTLADLEASRCKALMTHDIDGLSRILDDDLAHIHLNGTVDGKVAYLDGIRDRFRFLSVKRDNLRIRIVGDTAVMIGDLIQRTKTVSTDKEFHIKAVTTQVWARKGDAWVLNTCHNAMPANMG